MLKDFESFVAPAVKLAELNKATMEKMVAAQQAAAKEAVQLTEARINAALQIKDVNGLTAFMEDQVALLKSGSEKAVADSKSLIEDIKAYGEEVMKLLQPAAAPAKAKKAVKRTMKVVEPVTEPVAASA